MYTLKDLAPSVVIAKVPAGCKKTVVITDIRASNGSVSIHTDQAELDSANKIPNGNGFLDQGASVVDPLGFFATLVLYDFEGTIWARAGSSDNLPRQITVGVF